MGALRWSVVGGAFGASLVLAVAEAPAGQLAVPPHVQLLMLGIATLCGHASHALFRGRGRDAAAAAAPPLVAAGLALQVRTGEVSAEGLAFALVLAGWMIAASTARRDPTHHRARGAAVSLSLASMGLNPLAGAWMLTLCVLVVPGDASLRRQRTRAVVAMAGPVAVAVAAWTVLKQQPHHPLLGLGLGVGWPAIEQANTLTRTPLVYPAVAASLLLVLPLRWRGGGCLMAALVSALILRNGSGLLVPMPAITVLVSMGLVSWVFLAGTLPDGQATSARAWWKRPSGWLATVGACVTLWLAMPPPRLPTATAQRLPDTLPVDEFARSAHRPGDVVVAFDPELLMELRSPGPARARPDRLVLDGSRLLESEVAIAINGARASGKRVLSDSFDLGHSHAPGTRDVGLLFVVFGEAGEEDPVVHPATDPRWTASQHARMRRAKLEVARARRARSDSANAILALELPEDRRGSLKTSTQIAQAVGLPSLALTELVHDSAPLTEQHARLASLAEVGDLLYATGEPEQGDRVLRQAARDGYAPAVGALARWRLRAGQGDAAMRLLEQAAADPALAGQLRATALWLTARNRTEEAARVVAQIPEPDAPAADVAARLAILAASARR